MGSAWSLAPSLAGIEGLHDGADLDPLELWVRSAVVVASLLPREPPVVSVIVTILEIADSAIYDGPV